MCSLYMSIQNNYTINFEVFNSTLVNNKYLHQNNMNYAS
jgi:hypothetical protein